MNGRVVGGKRIIDKLRDGKVKKRIMRKGVIG